MKTRPAWVGAIASALGVILAMGACATPQDVRTASKDLTDRTEAVRSDLEGKQAELRRELKETRELAAELQSRLREVKDQDLSGVQGRLERQEKEIRDLQGRLENQSVQMSGLVGTVDQKLLGKFDDQAGRVVEIHGQVRKIEADGQATSSRLAEVEKNLARVADTMKEVAAKLSTQTQQHSAKLDETSKQMDHQVRTLSAQVNQFQGTLAEFSKVLHAMADKSTQADRRVAEVSGNTEGKVGLLIVQQGEQAAKIEQLTKRVEVEGQAVAMHLNEVTRNVTALTKTLDAAVATVNDTTREVGDLKQAMETSIGKPAARADGQGGAGGGNGQVPPAPAAKAVPDPAIPDKEAYDHAYLEFIQGRYNSAIGTLGGFLTRYPESPLVPNAHFWIAECYFRTHDYARGIEFYDHVITRYPKSGKASTALYRKALALLELKDKAAAKNTLRQLISDYPKSDDSARAQAKLSSLR
jgi:tol-pal system protein YbgF